MAMGDNYNDLEMLLFAGTGIVMANSALPLREIEGLHITASNDEDGVARAIQKFILSRGSEVDSPGSDFDSRLPTADL
jgi:hydroxymethylpyrimidine pyrophosphatase-like HAD family hydrolase